LWDLESRKELQTLAAHGGWINAVAMTPDGKRAVSAPEDQALRVWDIETGINGDLDAGFRRLPKVPEDGLKGPIPFRTFPQSDIAMVHSHGFKLDAVMTAIGTSHIILLHLPE
jgi:WD40 repeat protein